MNKKDLVDVVAKELEYTKKDVSAVIDAFLNALTNALSEKNVVKIADFGKFEVKEKAGRMGRNPRTGESIEIPAKNFPKFTPSKHLKDVVA